MANLQGGNHKLSFRVDYEGTDAGVIVYYASIYRFGEHARTELVRMIGINHKSLMEDEGVAFIIRSCGVKYIHPAYLDGRLEVNIRFVQVRDTSLDMDQSVKRDCKEPVYFPIKFDCVGNDGKFGQILRKLRDAIADSTILSTSQNLTGKRNYN